QSFTIPSYYNVALGDDYLLIFTDVNNFVSESVEANNITAVPIKLLYPADLTVSTASAPASALVGQSIPVSWTVTNQGSSQAFGSWTDAFYLSNDNVLDASDTLVAVQSAAPQTYLAAGDKYSLSQNITIPTTATSGNQYLLVAADYNNQVFETDE